MDSPTYTLGLVSIEKYEKGILLKDEKVIVELEEGEWSPWILDVILTDKGEVKAAIRVKLAKLAGDGKDVRLYSSDFYNTRGWCSCRGLEDEIVENVGPYA